MIIKIEKGVKLPLLPDCVMVTGEEDYDFDLLFGKSTYLQAIRLYDKFNGKLGQIHQFVMNKLNADDKMKNIASRFIELLPDEIASVGPMIMYLVKYCKVDWDNATNEDLIGYMHIFSQMYDLNALVNVDINTLNDIGLSDTLLNSYKNSWEVIIREFEGIHNDMEFATKVVEAAINKMVLEMPAVAAVAPVSNVIPAPIPSAAPVPMSQAYSPDPVPVEEKDDDAPQYVDDEGNPVDIDFSFLADLKPATIGAEKKEEKKEEEKEEEVPIPDPEPAKEEPKSIGSSLDVDQRKAEAAENNKILQNYGLAGYVFT